MTLWPRYGRARVTAGKPRRLPVARWITRRLAIGVVVVASASVVVFAATQALPSDPARAILGRNATPERVAALRVKLDLDRPIVQQYTSWLSGLVRGDLGTSLATGGSVAELLGPRVGNSLILLMLVAVIALPLSFLIGVITAIRRDRLFDRSLFGVSLGLTALPEFVIGMVLVIVFATNVFHVLPAVALVPSGDSPLGHPRALVLPVATLVLAVVPGLYRLVRASMVDVLETDYIQMARLKGLPKGLIARRHALPNAAVPTIQESGLVLGYLLSGIIVIEYIFRFPGLGTSFAEAVANRDMPVIQAITMFYAIAVVIFSLATDVVSFLLSPRARTARQ